MQSGNAATRDVTYVTLMPKMYRSALRCTDNTLPRPTSGMELMSGGSKRLPCNVKSDEMGNWLWICESLVIVFLTETCHRLLSSVKGSRERRNARASTQAEELAIHQFSDILLNELKQENAHPKREEGDQLRLSSSGADCKSGCCDFRVFALQ